MVYLRSIHLRPSDDLPGRYPFSIPVISTLGDLEFPTPVTIFAGENGSGKSTLLEGIAAAAGSVCVRGDDAATEATLAHAHELAAMLRLGWSKRTRRGFFLRAEDFFDYTKRVASIADDMAKLASEFGDRLEGYGRELAVGAAMGQRGTLVQRYGEDMNARSHGEGFLQFFHARFTAPGLYLLDEPDTALSAQSMLALLSMMKRMVEEGSQFIIATHSPMVMAFPGAAILSFDAPPIARVPYEAVDQVSLMKAFLDRPEAFLRRL